MEVRMLREDLIRSLNRIYRLEAFSALSDLLQGETLVLHFLSLSPDRAVFPSALSQGLHLSRSRITAMVQSLRRKGLVSTVPSPDDGRMVLISLTGEGQQLIGEKVARMEAYFDRMIEGIGAADAGTLIGLIDRCVDVMGGDGQ